jgi:hypothetical protein
MEVLLELLFEILGEVILELLLEGGLRKLARLLSNRIVRTALVGGLGAGLTYGGGYWWGSRLTELGRTDPPRSLWVSIGLAVLFIALATVRALGREPSQAEVDSRGGRFGDVLRPWSWSLVRLLGFALLNAAAAAGMATGFTPRSLG